MSSSAPASGSRSGGGGNEAETTSSASSSSSSSSSRPGRKMCNADAIIDEAAAAADRRKRRRAMFGDCALVEIIHLHDCLRGALGALQRDVNDLSTTLLEQRAKVATSTSSSSSAKADAASGAAGAAGNETDQQDDAARSIDRVADIERRVAGRFKVIWSVFQAHSAAEDEFIWPALQKKQADITGGGDAATAAAAAADANAAVVSAAAAGQENEAEAAGAAVVAPPDASAAAAPPCIIEQEEYEEDHANEERMFETMDTLLARLRAGLSEQRKRSSSIALEGAQDATAAATDNAAGAATAATSAAAPTSSSQATTSSSSTSAPTDPEVEVHEMAQKIDEITHHLKEHLMAHLDKEETHCMPLVVKHLNKDEIHDLVGQIMGKRSSDQMSQIMTMAVQNLSEADRDEMVRYMKQAMVGTFFERWLTMSGWMSNEKKVVETGAAGEEGDGDLKPAAKTDGEQDIGISTEKSMSKDSDISETCPFEPGQAPTSSAALCSMCSSAGRCLGEAGTVAARGDGNATAAAAAAASVQAEENSADTLPEVTTPEELERLIRAVASNQELSAVQKSTTIQGLRDSVWKSQVERKRKLEEMNEASTASAPAARGSRRVTPPSSYWKKKSDGTIELIWSSDSPKASFPPDDKSIPLFSASELAPTYFDGATSAVMGCPHYARSCKLRHPSSGRLYTCRLCCEQEREMPMKDQDSPLDRYEVTEILCMKCGALQPVGEKCCNPKCESGGKPFAKWYCKICNLFDDSIQKNIYHCPFCNVCRAGRGLGIDYRHCMRCNACVSLSDKHTRQHSCIPQRLQGNCPICHESMFQSIEPLRGLKCGHVMHLSCFGMYLRGGQWTCPLCKKSVEDMSEYFAMLDAAVRMQPMPAAYADTMSNVYCQDCGKSGVVPYHFVGIKCSHCGSYNTRELGRGEGVSS